ncbi:FG-GAP repeat domain-containing protein [Streptomyces sp. NPDC059443]|uniref:FG-GAP repeat domain-containing protein n=2 Tax=Streptomyces TaxID=1883 RepID=UPI0036CEFDE3
MSMSVRNLKKTTVATLVAAAAVTGLATAPSQATGTSSVGGAITSAEIMSRAQYWVDRGVPYSQSDYDPDPQGRDYRQDCSGLISMAWHLNTSLTTWTLPNVATQLSSLDDLQPGDMLDNIDSHVVLFGGWADAGHTTAKIWEEARPGTNARIDSSYYTRSYLNGHGYRPYRYNKVVEATPTPTAAGMTSLAGGDFGGDGKADVVAVEATTGILFYYPGTSGGQLGARVQIGTNWNTMSELTSGYFTGSGKLDLAAVDNDGALWIYPGNGNGTFGNRIKAGTGWDGMHDLAGIDLNKDGKTDLAAVETSTGNFYIYPGNGNGTFGDRVQIGSGWNAMDQIVSPGDLNKDGKADLVTREAATGNLYAYLGSGSISGMNTLGDRVLIGTGWGSMTDLVSGDFNGDGIGDVDAVQASPSDTGTFYSYPGTGAINGTNTLGARVQIGTGW